MICSDCGREDEDHPSGLCDSCETQRRYDGASVLDADDLRRRADYAERRAREHGQPEGAGFLDGYAHALSEVASDLETATPARRYLVVVYDVTDLTEAERDALEVEAVVQAERSKGGWGDDDPGHPSVRVRSILVDKLPDLREIREGVTACSAVSSAGSSSDGDAETS